MVNLLLQCVFDAGCCNGAIFSVNVYCVGGVPATACCSGDALPASLLLVGVALVLFLLLCVLMVLSLPLCCLYFSHPAVELLNVPGFLSSIRPMSLPLSTMPFKILYRCLYITIS